MNWSLSAPPAIISENQGSSIANCTFPLILPKLGRTAMHWQVCLTKRRLEAKNSNGMDFRERFKRFVAANGCAVIARSQDQRRRKSRVLAAIEMADASIAVISRGLPARQGTQPGLRYRHIAVKIKQWSGSCGLAQKISGRRDSMLHLS